MLTAKKIRFILLTPALVTILVLSGCLDKKSKKEKLKKVITADTTSHTQKN